MGTTTISTIEEDRPTSETTLNPKEQRVCDEFLRAGGAMSMREAYATEFQGRGCPYKFFRREPVSAYIASHQRAAADRTGVSIDRTLKEVAALAFSNIKDLNLGKTLDLDGNIDLSGVPDYVAAAIQSIEVTTKTVGQGRKRISTHVTKIRFYSKIHAQDMLFKVLGAYKKDGSNPHVDDALAALVKAIGDRGLPKPGEIVPPGQLH